MSTSSSSSSSPEATSGYTWILDHLTLYPGTNELPLRTMYWLNSTHGTQRAPSQASQAAAVDTAAAAQGDTDAPKQAQQDDPVSAVASFRSNLMAEMASLPSQPCSLPPTFITNFVCRVLPRQLTLVDFPQALTAMDYLRDLDNRRRREYAGVLTRLGIKTNDQHQEPADGPVHVWAKVMERKVQEVDKMYTSLYIGLRRWIMINEMSLSPFNVTHCVAMLNTLYPPTSVSLTRLLTPAVLEEQRHAFARYIKAVEKNGPSILDVLMRQGARSDKGEEHGWYFMHEILDRYLRATNGIIEDCAAVIGVDSIIQLSEGESKKRNGRQVDSGVSFASSDRPSTSTSGTKDNSGTKDRPLPASPTLGVAAASSKPTSALEKLVNGFRRLSSGVGVGVGVGRKRDDSSESNGNEKKEPPEKRGENFMAKSLKKVKSTSALRDKKKSGSAGSVQIPPFDIDDDTRRRAIAEATAEANTEATDESKRSSTKSEKPRLVSFEA